MNIFQQIADDIHAKREEFVETPPVIEFPLAPVRPGKSETIKLTLWGKLKMWVDEKRFLWRWRPRVRALVLNDDEATALLCAVQQRELRLREQAAEETDFPELVPYMIEDAEHLRRLADVLMRRWAIPSFLFGED